MYKSPYHYTKEELIDCWKQDLLTDVAFAKNQAENGPYFPERGITKESLLKWADKCRKDAADAEQSLKNANIGF